MTSKKIKILAVGAIATSLIIGAQITSAANNEQNPERFQDREVIHTAIEVGDFNAFKDALPERAHFLGELTEEDFVQLQKAHELREAGDHEAAKEIMEAAGIKTPMQGHKGKRQQNPENQEKRAEVEAAIKAGDFTAFQAIIPTNAKFLGEITEENFSQLQKAHELREAGDHEGAKEIMEAAGFKRPGKHMRGSQMRRGQNQQ